MELTEILKTPEGKTLEFKRDLSSPQGLIRTVTAFANTAGRIVVIGVEDNTHYVIGIQEPLEVEFRTPQLR